MSIDPFTIAIALAGVFLIAFMKGAFGGGFAIIGIPLLSLVMDPLTAGALLAPLFVLMDVFALRYWNDDEGTAALTMASFRIRPFEADDLPAMQRLRQAAFRPVFQSFRELVGEEVYALSLSTADTEQAAHLTSLCDPASRQQVFVALSENEIVGFVSFSLDREKRTGEIGLNAVHPDHAGRGIGTALYEFATDEMKRSGMILATVGTGGDPSHAPAQRAYRKAGFGPSLPSVWMYKIL